ncbi:hypothetical protein QBC40DRAFT_256858 [Triangularia verruculosa]|uniref:Uncharacterized protein n=1 Tax=Triangularia verruculosa TaxID=2587418 RepID=A0AAN6XDY8_9PEZI|nr:hypothetical protein QBC40DRAFT_256858 [Triangularia verruculosa]
MSSFPSLPFARPRSSTLGGWHPPASWFERQRPYAMPEGIRLCRLNSNKVYTAEDYGDLEAFWNPTFHRPRLDCIPDTRPADFAQNPDAVKTELRRSISDPTFRESIQIAKDKEELERRARLVAMRANPDPKDPFMKAIRPEDWERLLPTPPTPPPSPARAFPTSLPEEKKRLPKPRYSWFGFGPAVVPPRYQFVGAAEKPSKGKTAATPSSVLGKHARDSGDEVDDDEEVGLGPKVKRQVTEVAGRMGWVFVARGFVRRGVSKVGDQMTVAAFMVLCSVLFFLAVMGAGLWVVAGRVVEVMYGEEEIREREGDEFVEDGESRGLAEGDQDVEGTAREGGDRVADGVGVEGEALETYSRWTRAFVAQYPHLLSSLT